MTTIEFEDQGAVSTSRLVKAGMIQLRKYGLKSKVKNQALLCLIDNDKLKSWLTRGASTNHLFTKPRSTLDYDHLTSRLIKAGSLIQLWKHGLKAVWRISLSCEESACLLHNDKRKYWPNTGFADHLFIKITNRSSPIATIEIEEKTTVSNTTNRCCRTDLTRYRPYCLEPSASSSSVAPYSEADPYGCEKVVKKWQPAHPATLIYKMKYNMNQEKMDTCTSRLLLSATRRFT